jgi:hypothetical protein
MQRVFTIEQDTFDESNNITSTVVFGTHDSNIDNLQINWKNKNVKAVYKKMSTTGYFINRFALIIHYWFS